MKNILVGALALFLITPAMNTSAAKDDSGNKIDLTEIEARLTALENSLNSSVSGSTYQVFALADAVGSFDVDPNLIETLGHGKFGASREYIFNDDGSGTMNEACSEEGVINTIAENPLSSSNVFVNFGCIIALPATFGYTQVGRTVTLDFGGPIQEFTVSSDGGTIFYSSVALIDNLPLNKFMITAFSVGIRVGN